MTALRIDLVRTNGIFSLDGQDFEVEHNVWIVGDDHEVLVIDAAHEAAPIAAGVAGRRTRMIVAAPGTTSTSTPGRRSESQRGPTAMRCQ